MDKKVTLEQNIDKLTRVAKEVKRLSNPDLYYRSLQKAQYESDRQNRRHLKLAIKSLNRLTKVITKQWDERKRELMPI